MDRQTIHSLTFLIRLPLASRLIQRNARAFS
jgi:hypothetical protein